MSARAILGLTAALVVAAVVARSCRSRAVSTPPVEAPVGGASGAARVAFAPSLPAEGGDPGEVARAAFEGRPDRGRALALALAGDDAVGAPVRVELLFGDPSEPTSQRLRLRHGHDAEWASGAPETWPFAADLGFPTRGGSVVEVRGAGRYELSMPPTCVIELVVKELDLLPAGDGVVAFARVPGAPAPANRWHRLDVADGRAEILAEAAGQQVEFSAVTASGRRATGTSQAAWQQGARVTCELELPGDGGYPIRLHGLPEEAPPWRVDVYWADGTSKVRAPRRGDEWLVFLTPARVDSKLPGWPLDQGAFALAAHGKQRRWGVLRQRAAAMRPFQEVARGRVVDRERRGAAGRWIDLVPARLGEVPPRFGGLQPQRAISRVRTAPDGSFVITGPDPREVDLALIVRSTGERVELPQTGPLALVVPR
ncbi:MAG: hypothetical protein VX044_10460 [Planctomycetota bacterium]|nr:hypothetical protein [Planctomycetota bacterium]